MANLSAYSTGQSSGEAVFSNLSVVNYARTVYLTVNNTPTGTQSDSWYIDANAVPDSSYSTSFSSLLASTRYTVNCTVYRNTPWEIVYSNSASFTTDSPPVIIPGKPTNISHTINGQDCMINFTKGTNADGTWLRYYYQSPESGFDVYTTGTSFSLTGLGNNSTYYYYLYSTTEAGQNSGETATYSFTTETGRPGNFYWHLTMTSGGDAEIAEDDWFYFKNKINEFRVYKGLSNYVYSYQPSRGDDLSAADFNQVRNALYALRSYMTGAYSNGALMPATQTVGNDVAAYYFINMQNSLNSIT